MLNRKTSVSSGDPRVATRLMTTITARNMRTALRLTALGVGLVCVVFWLFGGPNLGWTRTRDPVTRVDPVTELEYVEWQRNFVPGVDFLALGLALGAAVLAGSWLAPAARRENNQPTKGSGS